MPPKIPYNFEGDPIPVADNFFDTTLCFDVLEHCDDPYFVFRELCRISNRYVIIALPNNWVGYFSAFIIGKSDTIGYGLPPKKQNTGIRHKWFFNLQDAEVFLKENAAQNNFKIRKLDYVFDPANNLIRCLWYPSVNYLTNERIRELITDTEYRKYLGVWCPLITKLITIFGEKVTFYLIKFCKLILQCPFFLVDIFLKKVIWGWGSRYRYLNLFCRQIWVVLEREDNRK
jgi:SAM-dependent methyltransferase